MYIHIYMHVHIPPYMYIYIKTHLVFRIHIWLKELKDAQNTTDMVTSEG